LPRLVFLIPGRFRRLQEICSTIPAAGVDDRVQGEKCRVIRIWSCSAKSPRSSVGKAFQDLNFDNESMTILAQSVEFAIRKGIDPPLPGEDKIQCAK